LQQSHRILQARCLLAQLLLQLLYLLLALGQLLLCCCHGLSMCCFVCGICLFTDRYVLLESGKLSSNSGNSGLMFLRSLLPVSCLLLGLLQCTLKLLQLLLQGLCLTLVLLLFWLINSSHSITLLLLLLPLCKPCLSELTQHLSKLLLHSCQCRPQPQVLLLRCFGLCCCHLQLLDETLQCIRFTLGLLLLLLLLQV
jgi:hypothetical protein